MLDLSAALKAAKPGDTIRLPAGTYSGLSLDGFSFAAPGVTITSDDPAQPAVLTNFNIGMGSGFSGLTFSRLDLKVLTPNWSGFNIYSSQHITFDHVHVYGPAGAPDPDVQAVNFFDCSYITFTNSEVEQVSHGLSISRSDHVVVSGNNIHHVNSDTLDFVQVSNAVISGNALHDFFTTDGNHSDAMQFGTANSTVASHDVTISDNLIFRGGGGNTQGIFISDELGTMPFADFTVADNLIIGTGSSAIRPTHSAGITITGNELLTLVGGDPTPLLVQDSDRVSASGNAAVAISVEAKDGNTNVTLGQNALNAPVSHAEADARVRAWFAAHPGPWSQSVPPPPAPAPAPDPRDAEIAKLQAALTRIIALATAANAKKAGPTKTDGKALIAAAKAGLA
jgi:hypothetical protein